MFFPVSTDSPTRRTPIVNYLLIALNVVVFVASHGLRSGEGIAPWARELMLRTEDPAIFML